MAFRPGDARIFLGDSETAILENGTEIPVILEFPESVTDVSGVSVPGQVGATPTITYETAAADFGYGDLVTIDGVRYAVGAPRKIGDGVMSIADLNRG